MSTTKAMCSQGIDYQPIVTAGVGTKQGGTQSQSNCHRDSLVLHMQAKGRNWQGFQPGSRFIAEEASRRARALGSGADSRSLSAADVTVTRSQDFWCDRASPSGGGWLCPFDHVPLLHHNWDGEHHEDVSAHCGAQRPWRQRLRPNRLMVLNVLAILIPNPPDLTGRVAWLQLGLSLGKWMLVISLTMASR